MGPYFRFDGGHIVQAQPRAACNASHMSRVQASNSIALVIYGLVSKWAVAYFEMNTNDTIIRI